MEKINVAELLKDCPKGMELDCVIYGGAKLDNVTNDKYYPIKIIIKDDINGNIRLSLTKEGYYNVYHNPKCVIFSKGKTTWEGFQRPFKDGDILYCDANDDGDDNNCYKYVFILKKINKNKVIAHCFINVDRLVATETYLIDNSYPIRFATEEEKEKLFQAIKDNGYKWNPETKTLEKLIEPKFKVGDRIKKGEKIATIVRIYENYYDVRYDSGIGSFTIDLQDEWELVSSKFDITTLTPFESKVLVRAVDNQFWRPAIWGVKHRYWDFCCVVGGEMWEQCIPYEGNEHLLGTTDNCDEYYKTWE